MGLPQGRGKLLWPGHEGLSRAQFKAFKSRWENLLENRSAGIIVFSEGAKNILKETFGVAEERLRVLPAFYDLGLGPSLLGRPGKRQMGIQRREGVLPLDGDT